MPTATYAIFEFVFDKSVGRWIFVGLQADSAVADRLREDIQDEIYTSALLNHLHNTHGYELVTQHAQPRDVDPVSGAITEWSMILTCKKQAV